MSKQLIISVSREYGSGGHEIAEKISKALGIRLIDRTFLKEIAEAKHLNAADLERYDEKPIKMFMSRTVRNYSNSVEENIAQLQFDYLKELAAKGDSFVVVGRCSETCLAGNPNLHTFFILGDMEHKIERVMRIYDLDRDKARDKIRRHDRTRKAYHNNHSKGKWGDSRNYDLCINSSRLGVDGTTDLILQYIKEITK